jgi:hypothetical protein
MTARPERGDHATPTTPPTPPGTTPTRTGTATPDTTTSQKRSDHPNQQGTTSPTKPAPGTRQASARRARLAAMAQPRPGDSPHTAALRAMLRDQALMAEVTANVDTWPEPTQDQRQTIAALWHRPAAPSPPRTPSEPPPPRGAPDDRAVSLGCTCRGR